MGDTGIVTSLRGTYCLVRQVFPLLLLSSPSSEVRNEENQVILYSLIIKHFTTLRVSLSEEV
jgi:hypothetical protein